MAGQDFAQIEAPQPEDVRPMAQSKVLLLIIVALGVVAGGFAVGFMVGQEMGMQKAASEDEARLVAQLKKQQEELAELRAAAKKRLPAVSTTQVGELTFYNELPRQSVDPEPLHMDSTPARQDVAAVKTPEETGAGLSEKGGEALLKQIIEQELRQGSDKKSVKSSVAAPSLKSGGSVEEYYLQVASFRKKNEAESFLPKLSRAGYEAVIRRVELPRLGVWYRVYTGPFASKQAAEAAKREVKSTLNITGLIVKGG